MTAPMDDREDYVEYDLRLVMFTKKRGTTLREGVKTVY